MRFLKELLIINCVVAWVSFIAFIFIKITEQTFNPFLKIILVSTIVFGGIGLLNHAIYGVPLGGKKY